MSQTPERSNVAPARVGHAPAAAAPSDASPAPALRAEHVARSGLIDLMARYPWVMFVVGVVVYALSFSGRWRPGLDSAIYRGVANSLATGQGYTFAGEPQGHIYPGLALLLAGLDVLFGRHAEFVAHLLMTAVALLALWVTYKLVRLRFPWWVAAVTTTGVAFNQRFIQQSQELMTDMPFLLGVLGTFYGYERFRDATTPTQRWRAGGVLALGLVVAASMRPTFWVLAVALTLTSIVAILRRPKKMHFVVAGLMLVVAVGFFALDPRTEGFDPLSGGYEEELVRVAGNLQDRVAGNFGDVFNRHLNDALFGEPMNPPGLLLGAAILAGLVMVTLRQPLWGITALVLIAVTLVTSTVPRYYLMVLPVMWVGWCLLLAAVGRRLPGEWGGWLIIVGVATAWVGNVGGTAKFIIEQRTSDEKFLEVYKNGDYAPLDMLIEPIRTHTTPQDIVIGPYNTLLSYWTDRRVIGGRMPGVPRSKLPAEVARQNPAYIVLPRPLYHKKDPWMHRMVMRGIFKLDEVVWQDAEANLAVARVRVAVTDENWQDRPQEWIGEVEGIAEEPPAGEDAAEPPTTQPGE
ncbi:MAG: ArnT family glycosyltransferase [Phycisphaerae bacterium]